MENDTRKIPEFLLRPEPLTDEAKQIKPFKWAGPEVGTRHKLGGDPHLLKREDWPQCQSCRKDMIFYGQLDSINDDFCIADCGLIHVFICFDCCETKSIISST